MIDPLKLRNNLVTAERAHEPGVQDRDAKEARLKSLLRERLSRRTDESDLVAPDPPPRYDEVFVRGQEWLNDMPTADTDSARGAELEQADLPKQVGGSRA